MSDSMTMKKVVEYLSKVQTGQVVDEELWYYIDAAVCIMQDQKLLLDSHPLFTKE